MKIGQQIKWNFKKNGDLIIRDVKGNEIYYENSNGKIIDDRPKCENKIVEVDGIKYKLVKI